MKAKLVKENLQHFEKKSNHLSSLGVGKKAIIEKWLIDNNIHNFVINDDYTIDVNGDVNLNGFNKEKIVELPSFIQFNIIKGWFDISNNELISIKGCPKIIYESFSCQFNKLVTLEYCPKKVYMFFKCYHNNEKFSDKYILSLCDVQKKYIMN